LSIYIKRMEMRRKYGADLGKTSR